jgi:UDP-3-O-[3-hydroxymyristoyl] N-acetylglucosamine deacetylase
LAEGSGFINELHVIFRNPFLHNEVLRKLDFLPIGFLEVPSCIQSVDVGIMENLSGRKQLMLKQRTIKNPIRARGVGLHTGHHGVMAMRPAPINTGIVFRRVDLDPVVEIPVHPHAVTETVLCTTLSQDAVKVSTVEHLMSALAGFGIDNLYIDLDSDEVPIMDGSASHFIFLLQSAGLVEQEAPKRFIRIKAPIRVDMDNGAWAQFEPYEGFRLSFSIDFDHPAFDDTANSLTIEFSSTSYLKEISRARTFGFMKDVEALRKRNLALGGSLENAIVLDDNGVMNPEGLRNQDEFVRHKVLDAVGDLYMIGSGIVGAFSAYKSGHALNNRLLRKLLETPASWEFTELSNGGEVISYEENPSALTA